MRIIKKVLKQTAVYWAPLGEDSSGQQAYAAPVEIKCRWTDAQQEFLDKTGQTQMTKSVVMVDRDLTLLGALRLGLIADLTDQANPFRNSDTSEIRQTGKVPTLDAKDSVRFVFL